HEQQQQKVKDAFERYQAAQAGLTNAQNALNFAIQKIPQLDADRIYALGHSSAGRQALLWAAHEPRIKACATIAPEVSLPYPQREQLIAELDFMPDSFAESLSTFMPASYPKRLRNPIRIIHGSRDRVVPVQASRKLVQTLQQQGTDIKLKVVDANHFDVMDKALPETIAWLRRQAGIHQTALQEPDRAGLKPIDPKIIQDLTRVWAIETRLISAPTNHSIITRFRFARSARDVDYDHQTGQLYIAGWEGGLVSYRIEDLLRGKPAAPAQIVETAQIPERVVLKKLSDKTVLAYWLDNQVILSDAKTGAPISTAKFPDDDHHVNHPKLKYRRELAVTEDPDDHSILVNHATAIHKVDIETGQSERVGDQIVTGMPAWRYYSGFHLFREKPNATQLVAYGLYDWDLLSDEPAQRQNQLKRLAVDARLAGDGLAAALWNSTGAGEIFTPEVLRAAHPLPHFEDLFLIFRKGELGIFISDKIAGIQSTRSGQILAAEPIAALRWNRRIGNTKRLRQSANEVTSLIWAKTMNTVGARNTDAPNTPSIDTVEQLNSAVSESNAAWGLKNERSNSRYYDPYRFAKGSLGITDTDHSAELNQRSNVWAFADESRQVAIVVTRSDLLLFRCGELISPVLDPPPHLLDLFVGEEGVLPLPAPYQIES
ncbi:MAG: prolyl oligopeptidase family serine peptidase, partial [Pirellulales bacterium]|nr:prolyl oligopeptidase family serine peptidase [Pirellulales bacterium]